MFYNNFTGWSDLGKSMFGPVFELQSITNKVLEQITRENLSTFNSNMATTIKHMQGSNKGKSGEEFVKMPLELTTEIYTRGLNYTQNMCKICEDAIKEYKRWADSNACELCKDTKSSAETTRHN